MEWNVTLHGRTRPKRAMSTQVKRQADSTIADPLLIEMVEQIPRDVAGGEEVSR